MNPSSKLDPGDVLMVVFPEHNPRGHEQEGQRPAIVVGVPYGPTRYPMIWVVPLTSKRGPWQEVNPELYPVLSAGTAGLPRESVVLGDNLRALDRSRVVSYVGTLKAEALRPIRDGLRRLLES